MEPEIIVGLDIGTTKIACIVGRINEFGKVEIIALGKSESLGVRSGVVSNINRTVESIQRAVADGRRAIGCRSRRSDRWHSRTAYPQPAASRYFNA